MVKFMFSKLWFINIILVLGIIFFAVKTFDIWSTQQTQFPEPISSARQEIQPEKQLAKRNLPPESSYRAIADKNLFSADRKEYLPPTPDSELEPNLDNETEIKPFDGFGKNVTLYGVMIWNDTKKALITNPDRKSGDPQDIWIQKGDTLLEINRRDKVAALKVHEILNDRVLVKDGSSKYEILLYDKEKTKQREMITMDQTPEVIAPRDTPRPAARTRIDRSQKRESIEDMASESNEEVQEPQFEIINTPFGEIKRRIN
jgi:hypothetical protein